ncbi:hypothetical protein SAMN06265222_12532 [Neorhodopirellula lusitana]|uniref:Secreted protein n=1 Tax=Neorhodopirellula lusitana TaxID=445327 RepID=A0ABY1QRP2_9BACT|nr:hypothetical protein [Neorhodopirellula lusitana]SMP78289.1 hypothetical protein SAMN06265222_12532 [Neorhodopirellula lusitana]
MTRLLLKLCVVVGLFVVVGCGGSQTGVPFDQSELDKHVEENPVPLVTDSDFQAADDANL